MLALLAFSLTVESIMRGPALVGQAPRRLRWSADGSLLRFSWAKPDGNGEPEFKEYQVRRDGTGLGSATPETAEDRLARLETNSDGSLLYVEGGSLYLRDNSRTEARKLPIQWEGASGPLLIEGGKAVAFIRRGAIYRAEIADGKTTPLAHLELSAPTPAAAGESPSQKALAEEQARLFKSSSPSGSRGTGRPGLRDGGRAEGGETGGVAITIPAGQRTGSISVSPSGEFAAIQTIPESVEARRTEVPSYMPRSGYAEMLSSYSKVGDGYGKRGAVDVIESHASMLVVNLKTGHPMRVLTPKAGSIGPVTWSPDGQSAAYFVSSEDHKDGWVASVVPGKSQAKTIWTEHDDAWVGGPLRGFIQWTPEGRLAFGTERDGYANLWTVNPDGSDARPLVSGTFEVSDVTMDRRRGRFVFVSSEGSPFKRHVDAVPFSGGPVTKLAELSADEDAAYSVGPDGTLAVVRSSPARPAELWIGDKQVTQTPTEEWLSYPWIEAPIVMVPARDGAMVPAKLYKPRKWRRGGPAVLFVHGAGYLQNVYVGWSHYFRETMFNHLLMEKGYAVLDMDFRASAGYGKAWRTAIYRHMGGKDLDDNVDGARWLVKNLGVNPKRIGLYGGSYGGFLTLMAMFKEGNTFAAGAALPVVDWRNYHHGYTSPILNNPQDDPEAYAKSSPIEFAQGLKGALLICHGMVDVNVHFQDSVRLTERLIELGKENWSVAPYPVEDHAFTRPESWTDEYRRILALFDRTIGPGWRK